MDTPVIITEKGMKPLFESPETFTAYATIDAGNYMLADLQKQITKVQSPIEKAVDRATGYDDAMNKYYYEQTVVILEDIIAAKKVINADFSGNEEILNQLQNLMAEKWKI